MAELPSWWSQKAGKRSQNARSRAQERRRAAETGGRVQAGSGSSWRAAGDVVRDEELEEVKYTDKAQYPLTVKELRLIRKKALRLGREPAYLVEFSEHGIRARIVIEDA